MLSLRSRVGGVYGAELPADAWSGELVARDVLPSSLQVTAHPDAAAFLWRDGAGLLPGAGCVLDDGDGALFSGVLTEVSAEASRVTLTFDSDDLCLWERVTFPAPGSVWSSQGSAYWTRTATPAETVGLDLVREQLGASALAARQVFASGAVPASLGRGSSRSVALRFDTVGRYLADLGDAEGLRFRVLDAGAGPVVSVVAVPDLSGSVVYGSGESLTPGLLADGWSVTLRAPDVTRAMVAGGGTGSSRVLVERGDADAELAWSRRVERLVEDTSTTTTATLEKAGDDALAEGAQPVLVRGLVVADAPGLRLGVDVPLGARVGVDLAGLVLNDRVRVIRSVIDRGRVSVTGVIGSADAGLTPSQRDYLALVRRLRKVPQ